MGSDTVAKTVWCQDEHMDQGGSEESNTKEANSQTVWYDNDEQTHEQLKQTKWDLSSAQKFDESSSQLLEKGLSSHQLCSALSQPHAAGAQPAPSHGLATQRQEVEGSRQEEEVGPDWQEGGEEGGSEEVWNRETTHTRKNSETADLEEWGEEKPEEREAKGRKKRRRRRKTRSSEAKLSSSSSIESYNQYETHTEQGTSLNCQCEAKDQTGRTHIHAPTISEPTRFGEEADEDAMHLPSQTESQTRGSQSDCAVVTSEPTGTRPANHGGPGQAEPVVAQTLETKESSMESVSIPEPDHFNSTVAASELAEMSIKKADGADFNLGQPEGKDLFGPTEVDLKESPTVDDMESKALSKHGCRTVAVVSEDTTGLVESNFPKELPVKVTASTEITEDLLLVVFPGENKLNAQSEDKPVQPVTFMEKPFVESVHPSTAQCLPCEGTADVRPLEIQEGSPETTHCSSSEMLRDLQLKEENRHEPWVGEEEGEDTSWKRTSEESDYGEMDSDMEKRQNLKLSSLKREDLSNDDLVITAVAVVTVAIASAVARVELSQQLAGKLPECPGTGSSIPALVQDATVPTDKQSVETMNGLDSGAQAHGSVLESVKSEPKAETLVHKEEIQSEATLINIFPLQLSEDHKVLPVNISPLPETHDGIIVKVDGQGHMQLQNQLPCVPLDTGQQSEFDTATANPARFKHSPQEQSACQTQKDDLLSSLHAENKETPLATTDGHVPVQSLSGEAVGQGQEREQDSKTHVSHAEEHDRDPQSESLHEGDSHTLPLWSSEACPVVLCHTPPATDSSPEEPSAPTNTQLVEWQPCEAEEDSQPVTGTCQSQANGPVAVDDVCDKDSLDVVDGWRHREKQKLDLIEEARKDMFNVQDTPQKGK